MTTFQRTAIELFSIENPIYSLAYVTVYTVDSNGVQTAVKATLYDGITGTGTLANPQRLDSRGRFVRPVYIDQPVICAISGLVTAQDHTTGIINAAGSLQAVSDSQAAAAQGLSWFALAQRAVAQVKRGIASITALVALIPSPSVALNYLRVNAGATAYELRTPSQVLSDIGGVGLASNNVFTGTNTFNNTVATNNTITQTDTTKDAALGRVKAGGDYLNPYTHGRNGVLNARFDGWRQGTSFSSPADQTVLADGWKVTTDAVGTNTISRQAFTLGQTAVDGEPAYFIRWAQTVAAAATYRYIINRLPGGVRRWAGKQVTLSFWAKAAANVSVTPALNQYFGFGGAPSATVTTNFSAINLTTSWQRFTMTVTVPSISGKTLGTDNQDGLEVLLPLPTSGTFTIDYANVQLERGPVATAFEGRHIEDDYSMWPIFESAQQTITAAGSLNLGNSLFITPRMVDLVLVCTSADIGYSTGDVVILSAENSVTGGIGLAVKVTPTSVAVKFGSAVGAMRLANWGTGTDAAIDPTKWKLIVVARAA